MTHNLPPTRFVGTGAPPGVLVPSNDRRALLPDGGAGGRPPPGGGGDGQGGLPGPRHQSARISPPRPLAWISPERFLLYGAVFFSPFVQLAVPNVFFTLSDALFCAALAVLLLRRGMPSAPLGFLAWPWIVSFVLIVGGLHISSMMEGDMWRGVILLLQYSFCFLVLPLILVKSSEREAYRLLGVFIAGVIALDIHGIFTYYVIGYTPTSSVVSGNRRLETLTGGANPAACLNAMMIVVVLWLRLNGKLSFKVSAVLVSIMLVTIVLTSSNSGIIAMSAGILVLLVCSLRLRQMVKILPILALPAVFLAAGGSNYLPSTFQERVLNAVVSGDVAEAGTFESRSALMQEALDMINTDKIFLVGIGADQFRIKSVQETPVHNAFLILWAEGGILSLLGWLLFCSMGFITWSVARAKGVMPSNRAAVLASFVVFIVVANVSAHIYARYWYTALLLIMQPTLIGISAHFLRHERFAQTFRLRFTRVRKITQPWQVRAI